MRLKTATRWVNLGTGLGAAFWLVGTVAASAQTAIGNEVRVNPVPATNGVLLYPGGQYLRVTHPLLAPGESRAGDGPIHLHMPTHQAQTRRAAALTPTVSAAVPKPATGTTPPPKRVAAQPPVPKPPTPQPAPAPAPSSGYSPDYGAFGAPAASGAAGLDLGALAPAAAPPAAAPPASRLARAEPAPPHTTTVIPATGSPTPGLTKRSVILFAPQATDPAQSALGAIKFLAGDLNAAMDSPSSRIQIQAFGGPKGDKSSEARRLSLKRALAIRQVLIDDGVPSERIDVRAMGGADDSGPTDRVDVYIKA